MSSEHHAKILAFLAGEFSKKEGKICVRVDLLYAQVGFRDEELRSWDRAENPELFENFVEVERLTSMIVEIAEGHADAFGMGQHRYIVRTHQHLGGKATHSFKMAPAFGTGVPGEDSAMVPQGRNSSAEAMGVITQNNLALMRTNQSMFQASFGTLASLSENLRRENVELRSENVSLKRRLDEAESTKLFKEFEIAQNAEKNQLKSQGIKQLMNLATIAMAKFTGGNQSGVHAETPLGMLVFKFGDSLRTEQVNVIMKVLTMDQRAMFMEIMNMVMPPDPNQTQPPQQQPPRTNGTGLPSGNGPQG